RVLDSQGLIPMERYFAYGSNMNPARVRQRGLVVLRAEAARLPGCRLLFDKHAPSHPGRGRNGSVRPTQPAPGHADLGFDRSATVEGVLYWLAEAHVIAKMDRFEHTPVNYSRDVVEVQTASGAVCAWTYFANPAVRRPGLLPSRSYL